MQSQMSAWTCLVAALLVTPGIWSYLTMRYPSENQFRYTIVPGKSYNPNLLTKLKNCLFYIEVLANGANIFRAQTFCNLTNR